MAAGGQLPGEVTFPGAEVEGAGLGEQFEEVGQGVMPEGVVLGGPGPGGPRVGLVFPGLAERSAHSAVGSGGVTGSTPMARSASGDQPASSP